MSVIVYIPEGVFDLLKPTLQYTMLSRSNSNRSFRRHIYQSRRFNKRAQFWRGAERLKKLHILIHRITLSTFTLRRWAYSSLSLYQRPFCRIRYYHNHVTSIMYQYFIVTTHNNTPRTFPHLSLQVSQQGQSDSRWILVNIQHNAIGRLKAS